jgi:hypothetical protein
MEILDGWEEQVKAQHRANKELTKQGLIYEYGTVAAELKLQNFIDLGSKPMSILAFHNRFLKQARDAFVIGAYYPALTATCALGERILNHLILILRYDFKTTAEYRRICRKESFDNWDEATDMLGSWGVLLPEVVEEYQQLKDIRNRSIHFNPDVDTNERALALEAISRLTAIVNRQFGSFGNQPWFILGIRGASYIKKEA